jgi:hypothetical protein
MRQELADTLEQALKSGDYRIDLRKFSAALRERFGVVSTIKSVADPNLKEPGKDQQILSIVNETFAWSSQEGALRGQRMHVVLTPSIVDVQERKLNPDEVRFDPLKDRPTYDNVLAQTVRGALLHYVVKGNIFSDDFDRAVSDQAMMGDLTSRAETILSVQLESRENPFGSNDELYLSQAFVARYILSHLDRPEIAKLKRAAQNTLEVMIGSRGLSYNIKAIAAGAVLDHPELFDSDIVSSAEIILAVQLESRENPFGSNDDLYLSQAFSAGSILSHLDRPRIAKLNSKAQSDLEVMIKSRGLSYNIKAIAAGAVLDHPELFDSDIVSSAEIILAVQLESRENPFGSNDDLYLSQAFAAGSILSHLDRPQIAKLKRAAQSTLEVMIGSRGLSYNIKAIAAGEVLKVSGIADRALISASQPLERGGIDLNSRTLNMESSGQKVNITFDPAMVEQFKHGDFSGVKVQILDVVPINLLPLLGMKEDN